jgi:hypothetical protein
MIAKRKCKRRNKGAEEKPHGKKENFPSWEVSLLIGGVFVE